MDPKDHVDLEGVGAPEGLAVVGVGEAHAGGLAVFVIVACHLSKMFYAN